jgi:hypothetical protein
VSRSRACAGAVRTALRRAVLPLMALPPVAGAPVALPASPAGALTAARPAPLPLRHELEESSVALVVRPDGLLQLRLQLPWGTVLRQRLAPHTDAVAFLATLVNQPSATFARTVATVMASVERDLRLREEGTGGGPGASHRFARWQWPAPGTIQAALREELMSRMAEGTAFRHASRLPATAELRLGAGRVRGRLAAPALLGPVLLTVTHPQESFLPAGGESPPIPLRRG